MIWKQDFTIEQLNASSENTLNGHLGIRFTQSGADWLQATMPVDSRTVQPFRILHGGASAVLSETLGSVASLLCLEENSGQLPVGVEINCNHLRSVDRGTVTGRVSPVRVGRRLHVWNTEIHDENDRLICVSRLTVTLIERR